MQLYAHQKAIVDDDPKKCGLWLGTGSGKTRTGLMLARGSTLIIAPKTQVEDQNWQREHRQLFDKIHVIAKVKSMIATELKKGDTPKIVEQEKYNVPCIDVISKETFRRDAEKLPAYDTVIVDEAHTALGATPNVRWSKGKPYPRTSQLFEELEKYIKRTNPPRLYLVTATIIKSPMTVWAAGKILGRAWDFYKWRDTFYFRLPMAGREIYQAKSDSATKDRLAKQVKGIGYVGRLDDFFDVPEQTFRTMYIPLTEKQRARIKELPLEYPDPLVLVGKKHQVENGVLAGDEFNAGESFDNGKVETILDLGVEFPRMVVFCKYRAQIDHIATSLKKEGKKVLTLTGDTKERGKVILEANKSKECIFIAQAQISAGWELPEYPCMVFASRTYSFVDYDQALGRIQRSNNIKKNLYINLVVKGGIDEAVDRCLINKQDFNERIYLKK